MTRPAANDLVATIVGRELRTMARTKTYVGLAVVFAATLLALAVAGGGVSEGYGPVVVDLLTPLELLVPVVAAAFGYRAILGDANRGELELFRTYPIAAWQHAIGVYVGRTVGLLVAVVASIGIVGVAVTITPTDVIHVYASHEGADSPILFVRFVVLTALFAAVVLSLVLAISAAVRSTRSALALVAALVVAVVVGADIALVGGIGSGWVDDTMLAYATSLSPNSAYRGLVLETVVGVDAGPRAARPLASAAGLVAWGVVGLVVTITGLERR